jgi:hypothetical protein
MNCGGGRGIHNPYEQSRFRTNGYVTVWQPNTITAVEGGRISILFKYCVLLHDFVIFNLNLCSSVLQSNGLLPTSGAKSCPNASMSFFPSFLVIKRDALLADLISGTDWLAPGNEGEGSMPIKHLQNLCVFTAVQSVRLALNVAPVRSHSRLGY